MHDQVSQESSCRMNLGICYVRTRLHKGQQKVQHGSRLPTKETKVYQIV
ncbi:hypothetical protein PVAP13_9KG536726 [Panicum virgatum]|uniref:Uncharacterized protein n=1 Tax=Panicum virgatum TaxID=38727 RepID=A0A8T0P046_PANVG|nr:hypothetical protein PVAP13_9KG536726 [Panicum virgatum]